MSVALQKSEERGGGQTADWLFTRHSFSFADWFDPRHIQWGPLRVLNDDRVAAHKGFGFHSHRDMEIVTYILAGALRHRDSAGNDATVRPGEAQRMSAGAGVTHSEWNDGDGECHLLQIWIQPQRDHVGAPPSYEQAALPAGARENGWHVLAEGRKDKPRGPGTVRIHQDAAILVTRVAQGGQRAVHLAPGRLGYLFVAEGECRAGGQDLRAGDSLRFEGEDLAVESAGAHLLSFDLPPR
ncbi:MAG: pirin family protein [Halobacteriales archaeon]|nr:pirin family protein [Halobacteriales archaeon]